MARYKSKDLLTKTKDEIKYALNKKIKQLNVESEEELEEIVAIAKFEKKKSKCLY